MVELTENQIQQLYKFTEQHYVEWYDVQTELVDHLANGIEHQIGLNPELSFESALNNEFKKFGVLGFSEVVAQKTNALNKHYRRLVWQSFRAYFKLPKILLTIVLVLALWQILYVSDFNFKMFIIIGFLIGFQFILIRYLFIKSRKNKKTVKQTGKKLLINKTLLGLGDLLQIANAFLIYPISFASIHNSDFIFLENPFYQFTIAALIVFLSITLFVSIKVVPEKLLEKIIQQHPHYKSMLL